MQRKRAESWQLEDGSVKDASFSEMQGAGFRAITGEKTGFAYTNELRPEAVLEAASTASSIAKVGQDRQIEVANKIHTASMYEGIDPISTMSEPDKVSMLNRLDRLARSIDNRVERVSMSLAAVTIVSMWLMRMGYGLGMRGHSCISKFRSLFPKASARRWGSAVVVDGVP